MTWTSSNQRRDIFEFSDGEEEADPAVPPGHRSVDVLRLQDVWDQFSSLMSAVKTLPESEKDHKQSVHKFKEDARQWARDFRTCTFDEDVIPYIHALVYHVPQALMAFRYLPDIGVSQVERKNYDNRLAYFNATNRDGGNAKSKSMVTQIMERENLLLYFDVHPVSTPKPEKGKRRKLAQPGDSGSIPAFTRQQSGSIPHPPSTETTPSDQKPTRSASEPTRPAPVPTPSARAPEPTQPAPKLTPLAERKDLFSNILDRMVATGNMEQLSHVIATEVNVLLKQFPIPSMATISPQPADPLSTPLYPSDGPNAIPVVIKADGNCLPRCGSLAAFGTQELHDEIRVRVVAELVSYKHLYLSDEFLSRGLTSSPSSSISMAYMSYSGLFPEHRGQQLASTIFDMEVLDVRKRSRDMGMWQLHALASVLQRPILSVYPPGRGINIREHLHRMLSPRGVVTNPIPFPILWTHTQGNREPPISWSPNHFVACLPPANVLPAET
ncbi:uncharacterized protein [Littorina saxatilis]|uniref:uncharacterized protein n=1 Tax=Littorina saxatilis TaxID=31220 RepID=UPI0038B563FC